YPTYRMLRETSPVHRVRDGLWVISSYDAVSSVLCNDQAFSNAGTRLMMLGGLASGMRASEESLLAARRQKQKELGLPQLLDTDQGWNENTLISMDPPEHTALRHVINQGLTPRRVADLAPRIRQITNAAVDRILSGPNEFDLTERLASQLPVTVISEMLGVDAADADDFKRWSDLIISGITGELAVSGPEPLLRTLHEVAEYALRIVEERRRNPKDDLISVLVDAERGETLTPIQVVDFVIILLTAGNETTRHLIENAMIALLDHPEQLEKIRADPSLIPQAVEEVLRYDGPVQALFRQATGDVELDGARIAKGDILTVLLGSASHDDAKFPNGDRFDIYRDTQGHMGFGFGVHFCMGAALARLETGIALEVLLTRVPDLRRVDGPLERIDSFHVRGPRQLRLAYGT
ncbi:MAG: cytochrome P450, partial [Deltaproteobacteria bacterium]|nr:cytochrome P450 [Deltaproteobacteria bacterium]